MLREAHDSMYPHGVESSRVDVCPAYLGSASCAPVLSSDVDARSFPAVLSPRLGTVHQLEVAGVGIPCEAEGRELRQCCWVYSGCRDVRVCFMLGESCEVSMSRSAERSIETNCAE
jgi:hypothetical protein